MAIPSGSGTEVLKRASIHGLTNSYQTILTGVANHIYTILSVTFCETAGDPEKIDMRVDISASGSNPIQLLDRSDIAARDTFVWNDKIVLTGIDQLEVQIQSAGDVDVYVSYIDQDFT